MVSEMPCERVIWYLLPAIRKEIAKTLVKEGVSRKEVAEMLGVSQAAISQYIKSKRGDNIKFSKKMQKEIALAAKRMIKSKKNRATNEMCILCDLFRSKGSLSSCCKGASKK